MVKARKGNLPRGEPITTRRPNPNFERSNHLCSASLFPSTRAGGARAAKGNFSPLTSNQIVPLHPRSASCPDYIVSPGVQEIGHSFSPLRLLSRASGFVFVVEDGSTLHYCIYHCSTAVPILASRTVRVRTSRCRRHSLAVSACRRTRTRKRAWAARCC